MFAVISDWRKIRDKLKVTSFISQVVLTHLVPIWNLQVCKWLRTLVQLLRGAGIVVVQMYASPLELLERITSVAYSSRMHIVTFELETLDFSLILCNSMNFTSETSFRF